jgi:hypothetical protein
MRHVIIVDITYVISTFSLNLGFSGDLSELVKMVSQTRPWGGKTSSYKQSQILYKMKSWEHKQMVYMIHILQVAVRQIQIYPKWQKVQWPIKADGMPIGGDRWYCPQSWIVTNACFLKKRQRFPRKILEWKLKRKKVNWANISAWARPKLRTARDGARPLHIPHSFKHKSWHFGECRINEMKK